MKQANQMNQIGQSVQKNCSLCTTEGGNTIWQDALFRVVAFHDDRLPAYLRIISQQHVKEMTDFTQAQQAQLFELMMVCERLMRETLQPDKINLASLGNQTPHIHWHVIARWKDDAFFPDSIWSNVYRETDQEILAKRHALANDFYKRLATALSRAG
jgi:diadenosine tetraphosphate (Ap4A) HIT family hydrolase